jgi:hypothetical protein
MKFASTVAVSVLLLIATHAHGADATAQIAIARQRIETTDSRATGRLVQVDANGNRISNAFTIKAHWFPGVLRVLVEIVPTRTPAQNAQPDTRASILLEMRPHGQNSIRIFHPHTAPATLPFDKWGESVFGSYFNYEDFLQAEYYWPGQTILKTAMLGTHNCDVLKSTPGPSDRSHYAEVQTWLDQATNYPIYTEKTLREGETVKDFTSSGLTKSGGVWAARQVEVKIQGRPGTALLIIERGSTKANLTAKDFSPEEISKFEDHP